MRLSRSVLTLLLIGISLSALAQQKPQPKLVVGIVVDQMRFDFLFRYYSKYGEGGFKRLMNKGFLCKNTNYNYVPTSTAPGHAAIFTGTTPAINGIVGNDWYIRKSGKSVYCVSDTGVSTVGANSKAGKMSPKNLLVTTITDQLRLATNMQSKVIGIALKDRSSILPAGHTGTAYWYDNSGNWITSTYYMKQLPEWVNSFNDRKLPAEYLSKPWTTLLPIDQYTESTADDVPYEEKFGKEEKPVFPHDLPKLKNNDFDLVRSTPFGNTLTKEFAKEAIKSEKLGAGKFTDFITVSFSSTDYIGHQFGPNSIEVEDTYLRLDKDLEEFLVFLDNQVGKTNYTLFLSADHGAAQNEVYMGDQRIPGGLFSSKKMMDSLYSYLGKTYGEGRFIQQSFNGQIFLNHPLLREKNINLEAVQNQVAAVMRSFDGIANVVTSTDILRNEYTSLPNKFIKAGYNEKLSGDVIYTLQPGWMEYKKTGTTHGATYSYDTHVPLLWYGTGIPVGETSAPVSITDIAPTVAALLNIEFPNGTTGKPIVDIVK